MPTSEARISANRKNALKSTGPRTPEGKSRSRENAYKHGLTGEGVALPAEDAVVVAHRFDSLREQFDPRTPMGSVLVHRVAMLSVRLDRSYRRETANLAAKVEGAQAAFVDSRKTEAEFLLNHIMLEPRTNNRRLMDMPEGVDLLINAWELMKIDLEHQDGTKWTYHHASCADQYNGINPGAPSISPYLAWTRGLNGNFENLLPSHFDEGMSKEQKQDFALVTLQAMIDGELAKLREHRAAMDTRSHDSQLALAPEIALFDDSKGAILARKYEAATERGLYRALEELRVVEAEADGSLPPVQATIPEPIDPETGELASFFQATDRAQREPRPPLEPPATQSDSRPETPLNPSDSVPVTVGKAPTGPA